MTNIYINGASGKMGTNLKERSACNANINVCDDLNHDSLDVIIDFSHPDSILKLLESLPGNNEALIIGTTGFKSENIQFIKGISKDKRILLAPNLSIGVAILKKNIEKFIETNDVLLDCYIEEIHHTQKIDSPSGTAIELKRIIESCNSRKLISKIEINSQRTGEIFGIHKVTFSGNNQKIEFFHEAQSRNIFSDGALKAAIWLKDQKAGLYSFEDYLKLQNNL
tara:strand:+ start:977 stop:1648 length:672 start_codon:yes stop_codon:yes gene_type:complete